jgi:RNA polymerase sigma-70 factor (ECF subfamily)
VVHRQATPSDRVEENQAAVLLVRRCIAGEAAAWEEIVQLHSRRIFNICYRFTGSSDEAQDLSQEVFIRIYRTLKSFDTERGSFTTWLTTVARNLLVDHFRKSKLDRMTDSLDAPVEAEETAPLLSEKLADTGRGPQAHVESRETAERVQAALQKLSPELREAVILRDLRDMDYREIAEVLRVPEGTVKSRINRGRGELARLLSRTYRQAI